MAAHRDIVVDSARLVWSGYRHFLSAIALNWLVVGIAAAAAEAAPRMAQVGLFLTCAFFYTAAACRATGFTKESPIGLAVSRAGACIEPMLAALGIGLLGSALVVIGATNGSERGVVAAAALATLIGIAVYARIWPLFSIPFLFRGEVR